MNNTHHNSTGMMDHTEDAESITLGYHIAFGLLYFASGIAGCIGHVCLIYKFCNQKYQHATRWILQLSFCVANLGVSMGFMFPGTSSFYGRWLFGSIGCQLYAFEGICSGLASIWTLALLAIERYIIKCKPQLAVSLTTKHYGIAVGCVWANSLFWALSPIVGWGRYGLEASEVSCTLDWRNADTSYITYLVAISVVSYGIPFSFTMYSLWKVTMSNQRYEQNTDIYSFEKKMALLCIYLFIMSLLAWTPYAMLCFTFLWTDPLSVNVYIASSPSLVAKGVTCLVPYVYMLRMKESSEQSQVTIKGK